MCSLDDKVKLELMRVNNMTMVEKLIKLTPPFFLTGDTSLTTFPFKNVSSLCLIKSLLFIYSVAVIIFCTLNNCLCLFVKCNQNVLIMQIDLNKQLYVFKYIFALAINYLTKKIKQATHSLLLFNWTFSITLFCTKKTNLNRQNKNCD